MRRTAVAVGALFWISNLVTLVGSAIVGTIPDSAGVLTSMSPHATQVVAGTLIAHINDVAIIGYAVLLFPVLKRTGPGLALGYAAFKVVEAVLLLVSAVSLLSLIAVSHSFLAAGGGNAPWFKAAAESTLAQQFWAARLAALVYIVGTLILNAVLYRAALVPRFLPVWGVAAVAMLAAGLAMGVGDPSRGFQPGQVLLVPIILWELTFATWLIVRGFKASRLGSAERGRVRADAPFLAAGAVS